MVRLALAGVAAAAIVGVLLRDAFAPPGPSLLLLLVAFCALAVLVAAEVRRPRLDRRAVLALGAVVLVAAVAAPPRQSRDLWVYAMYGRMVAHHHVSPYRHVAAEFPHDPWTAKVPHGWRQTRSVYGPLFTGASAAAMAPAGNSFLAGRLIFQLLAAAGVAGCLWLIERRTRSAAALALLALNPVVVVSVVNGGHNDALVGLAVLGGVLLAGRRPVVAGLVLGAAVLIKAAALLPLGVVAVWLWRRRGWRAAAGLGAVAGACALVGYAFVGGRAALAPLRAASLDVTGGSVWYGPKHWLADAVRLSPHRLSLMAAGAVLLLAAVVAGRRLGRATPALAAGGAVLAYMLAGAYVLPWYVFWGLPVLALCWRSPLAWVAAGHAAVLLLAQLPDLTLLDNVRPLFIQTPLQRLRLDVYVVWLPLVEVSVLAALVATSLRRRVGEHDVAGDQAHEHGPVVIGQPGPLVAGDDLGVGSDGTDVVGAGVVAEHGRRHR
jgi:glycosyl transferase family 87